VYRHCERSEAISHSRLLRPLRFTQGPRNDSYNGIFLRLYPELAAGLLINTDNLELDFLGFEFSPSLIFLIDDLVRREL
jgi:hypothetical protein